MSNYDYLIVGAGLSGCVMAERIASVLRKRVLIVEKRDYIGGLCATKIHSTGIEYPLHGPHTFHTSDETIWKYVNMISLFNDYRHKILDHRSELHVAHNDLWSGMPIDGWNTFFNRLVSNDLIDIKINCSYSKFMKLGKLPKYGVIYTGNLEDMAGEKIVNGIWKSASFEIENHNGFATFQGFPQVDYQNEDFVSTHEPKHYYPNRPGYESNQTIIIKQRESNEGEPYFSLVKNKNLFNNYDKPFIDTESGVCRIFLGRLPFFRNIEMDVAVKEALDVSSKINPDGFIEL